MEINHKKQGKRNRQAGARFELKVRKDLESKGWVVDRWTNNVEFLPNILTSYAERDKKGKLKLIEEYSCEGKIIPAKSNRFNMRTTGFPDFLAFRLREFREMYDGEKYVPYENQDSDYVIEGIECKSNGYLTKEEKEKCRWLLDNHIFSEILIASKGTKRGQIVYKEFNALSSKG